MPLHCLPGAAPIAAPLIRADISPCGPSDHESVDDCPEVDIVDVVGLTLQDGPIDESIGPCELIKLDIGQGNVIVPDKIGQADYLIGAPLGVEPIPYGLGKDRALVSLL